MSQEGRVGASDVREEVLVEGKREAQDWEENSFGEAVAVRNFGTVIGN